MKIVLDYPPNYAVVASTFDLSRVTPVFMYGEILYNPAGIPLESHIIAHEEVHERQQRTIGPKAWWDRYLTDSQFRIDQEIEAYREQYRFVKNIIKDRNKVARFLHAIATDLSGPMYGSAISYQDALNKIDCFIK